MADRMRRKVKSLEGFSYHNSSTLNTLTYNDSVLKTTEVDKHVQELENQSQKGIFEEAVGQYRCYTQGGSLSEDYELPCDVVSCGATRNRRRNIFETFARDQMDFTIQSEQCKEEFSNGSRSPSGDLHQITSDKTLRIQEGTLERSTQNVSIVDDQIIEQWYADPYERVNPELLVYDEWRRKQLELQLTRRGFNTKNTRQITSWLMRCRGQFKPMEDRRRIINSGVQVCNTDRLKSGYTANNGCTIGKHDKEYGIVESHFPGVHDYPTEHRKEYDLDDDPSEEDLVVDEESESDSSMTKETLSILTGQLSHVQDLNVNAEAFEHDSCQINGYEANHPDPHNCVRQSIGRQKNSTNLFDEAKIAVIKHRLRIFDIVYGRQTLQADEKRFSMDYTLQVARIPRSVPKSGFRTQGHYKLQKVKLPHTDFALSNHLIEDDARPMLEKDSANHSLNCNQSVAHGPEVYTEDPNFGITFFPSQDTASAEDLRLYYARTNATNDPEHRELANEYARDNFSYTLLREMDEVDSNEEHKQIILQQLQQKVFSWETAKSMKGLWDESIEHNQEIRETSSRSKTCLLMKNAACDQKTSHPPIVSEEEKEVTMATVRDFGNQTRMPGSIQWTNDVRQKAKRKVSELDRECEGSNKRIRIKAPTTSG